MLRLSAFSIAGFALLALSVPSLGQQESSAPHNCQARSTALPPELANWTTRIPIAAATHPGRFGNATLTVGKAVDAALVHTPEVHYPVRPGKPGDSASYGGIFAFDIDRSDTYRVALGSGAWVDIVKDGKTIASIAHAHGPDCSGIHKMVDFTLKPGSYILEIAANEQPQLALLVARRP